MLFNSKKINIIKVLIKKIKYHLKMNNLTPNTIFFLYIKVHFRNFYYFLNYPHIDN